MSDRVDTDNLRALLDQKYGLGRATILALCDEVDRLRGALREAVAYRWLAPVGADGSMRTGHQANHDARAALAEGNTERPGTCPTCGSDAPTERCGTWGSMTDEMAGPVFYESPAPDSWHRTTDTEGER